MAPRIANVFPSLLRLLSAPNNAGLGNAASQLIIIALEMPAADEMNRAERRHCPIQRCCFRLLGMRGGAGKQHCQHRPDPSLQLHPGKCAQQSMWRLL
ncbi:MAG: hypothetical protein JO032_13320 [Alphaproteobacteria bacterium]|nr:hypothetical protein [Alphaproteobacteria bacterium]